MKTIASMWELYKHHCGQGLTPKQHAELEQAFWGGATAFLEVLKTISQLDNPSAKAAYDTLETEVVEFNRQRLAEAARLDAESN
jgi:hypothetical protein